jgi:hypothetical protein
MKNHRPHWLYVFFTFFLFHGTVFALVHPASDFVTANAAGYTSHDKPQGAITEVTPLVAGENLFHRLLDKTGTNSVSRLSPVTNPHVSDRSNRLANSPSSPEELHSAVSGPDIPPVDNPVSLALLGISLLSIAGISRRTFAKKASPESPQPE